MKELDELKFPEDLRYSADHEWAKAEGGLIKVGICDYAQDQLGDIVYVELPKVGTVFEEGDEFGTVESVKAVSELYMPIAGEVMGINTDLEDNPEQVNEDPYGGGWMIKVKPGDVGHLDKLMDRQAYLATMKG